MKACEKASMFEDVDLIQNNGEVFLSGNISKGRWLEKRDNRTR
jgi:hypothetical protein